MIGVGTSVGRVRHTLEVCWGECWCGKDPSRSEVC